MLLLEIIWTFFWIWGGFQIILALIDNVEFSSIMEPFEMVIDFRHGKYEVPNELILVKLQS